jgi:hypothetical protein
MNIGLRKRTTEISYHGDEWRTSGVCAEVTVVVRLALTVSCARPVFNAICVKRPRKAR